MCKERRRTTFTTKDRTTCMQTQDRDIYPNVGGRCDRHLLPLLLLLTSYRWHTVKIHLKKHKNNKVTTLNNNQRMSSNSYEVNAINEVEEKSTAAKNEITWLIPDNVTNTSVNLTGMEEISRLDSLMTLTKYIKPRNNAHRVIKN